VLRLPAERFYWAVIEVPGRTNAARIEVESLRSLIADELPVPAGEVHPCAVNIEHGRILVCAAAREDLIELKSQEPHAVALVPSSVPPGIAEELASRINLLTGEFEPRVLQSERRTRWLVGSLAAAAVLAFMSFGLARRANVWREGAKQADKATAAVLDRVEPRADDGSGVSLDGRILILHHDLETQRGLHPPLPTPDAAITLAGLLHRLPRQDEVRTDFIGITPTSASVTLTTTGDPAPLVSELAPPSGWRLHDPRISSVGGSTRIALELSRTTEREGTSP